MNESLGSTLGQARRRIPSFEAVCLGLSTVALLLVLVPQEFAARRHPGAAAKPGTVWLALQTNEGLLASGVALAALVLCGQALYRKRPLGKLSVALLTIGLGAAVLGLADLSADMPPKPQSGGVWCASDPDSYFEPDLSEHFREISGDDGACMSVEGSFLAGPAGMLLLAGSALAAAALVWRTVRRQQWRRAGAALALGVTGGGLLVTSVAISLQHLS